MGLREQAAADLQTFTEDCESGFGWPISIENPDGHVAHLTGFASDIAETIDPDTGQAVSGRRASIALAFASIPEWLGTPVGVSDPSAKPWVVRVNDIRGQAYTFKITEARPDRALGIVVCTLETYRP